MLRTNELVCGYRGSQAEMYLSQVSSVPKVKSINEVAPYYPEDQHWSPSMLGNLANSGIFLKILGRY